MRNFLIAVVVFVVIGLGVWAVLPKKTVETVSQAQSATSTGEVSQDARYTLADVGQHAAASSCWAAINGAVYDLSSWISKHPGGDKAILSLCGKDGSAAFNRQHGGQAAPEATLAGFKIGVLAQ